MKRSKKYSIFVMILSVLTMLTILSLINIKAGNAYSGDLVINGTTVTLSGKQHYDNVYIRNGGKLQVDPAQGWLELNIEGEILIDSSSSIVLSAIASGPGDGKPYMGECWDWIAGGGGAGYGGSGGRGDGWRGCGAFGGPAYGDPNDGGAYTGSRGSDGKHGPRGPGGGGGAGGLGGGRVKIFADLINIEGSIQANGGSGSTHYSGGGGGSGGGITIKASNVIISGSVSADGGRGADGGYAGGGGAGGRITVIYGIKTITGSLTANGGSGGRSYPSWWPKRGYGVAGQNGSITTLVEFPVDIKPQSCPNPFNVKSKGVLPATILGTADFDVTTLDPASILLLDVAPLRIAFEDVATPFEPFVGKEDEFDCTDEGPDGFLDLTLKFDTQEVVHAIEALLERKVVDGEVLVLSLTGNLLEEFGGTDIVGEDVIVILKKGKK